MPVLIHTRSLEELNACRPLSREEHRYRLDMLAEIRRKLRRERRVRVVFGEDPATSSTFELELRPDRDDAERTLEKLEYLLGVAGFAHPEPWQGWMTLDAEELIIQNPADLAKLLKLVMKRSGLGPGQLSIKAGIHRSQVYLLTKAERGSVPRNSHQLRCFLRACRVSPQHADTVIAQWNELRHRRAPRMASPSDPRTSTHAAEAAEFGLPPTK